MRKSFSVFALLIVSLWLLSIVQAKSTTQPARAPASQPTGRLKYKLAGGSEKWDDKARQRIVDAMDAATELYNEHSDFDRTLTAVWSPGTPTADGNINGTIRFGGAIGKRVALHEIGHTLGIGTHHNWGRLMVDGKWTGQHACELLRQFDGPDAVLKGDRQHFWPYGLNYDKESSPENDIRHVKLVSAMARDLADADRK